MSQENKPWLNIPVLWDKSTNSMVLREDNTFSMRWDTLKETTDESQNFKTCISTPLHWQFSRLDMIVVNHSLKECAISPWYHLDMALKSQNLSHILSYSYIKISQTWFHFQKNWKKWINHSCGLKLIWSLYWKYQCCYFTFSDIT
jgi:hypothetical protein